MESLALLSKNSHLSDDFLKKNKSTARQIALFFGISEVQSVLLSAMINMNLKNPGINIEGLSYYFEMDPVSIMTYIPDLDEHVKMKILSHMINEGGRRRKMSSSINNLGYYINKQVIDAMVQNKEFDTGETKKAEDIFDFMSNYKELTISFIIKTNPLQANGLKCPIFCWVWVQGPTL